MIIDHSESKCCNALCYCHTSIAYDSQKNKLCDIKKISLLDTRDVKGMKIYQFSTERISSNSNDEFIFEVYKKQKEDMLIKVKLN